MNARGLLLHMATGQLGSCRQIGLRLRTSSADIGRYMRELAAEGLVEKCGTVLLFRSRVPAAVWRITEKGAAKAAALPTVDVKPAMAPGGGRRRK